jgi:hypothetical protein
MGRGAADQQNRKEQVWEEVRLRVSPDRPSRMGALYLFPTEAEAELALADWFKDSGRIPLEVVVPLQTQAHLADAKWLDCLEPEWTDCATTYWMGEMTAAPRRELLVHGPVYFPGWQAPPFGPLQGRQSP